MSQVIADRPPRSKRDIDQALEHYRHHRRIHPLPDGWTVDAAGIEWTLQNPECQPDPWLVCTTGRWRGELRFVIDLYFSGKVFVFITDESGDGLTPWEIADLLFDLIGVNVSPVDIEASIDAKQVDGDHAEFTSNTLTTGADESVAYGSPAPELFELTEWWEFNINAPYPPSKAILVSS